MQVSLYLTLCFGSTVVFVDSAQPVDRDVVVRRLEASDWPRFREIQLRALADRLVGAVLEWATGEAQSAVALWVADRNQTPSGSTGAMGSGEPVP